MEHAKGLHYVHFVRHGRVASHRGDVPVTPEGLEEARRFGRRLAERVGAEEVVAFLYAPTLRTRQTAQAIRAGLADVLAVYSPGRDDTGLWLGDAGFGPDGSGHEPRDNRGERGRMRIVLGELAESWVLRNPDLYVGGVRVEMVSTPEALAEQTQGVGLGVESLVEHPFFRRFWDAHERVGYWMTHPDPPGEDAATVARRLRWFAASLRDLPTRPVRRFVCVTHSGPMRAFLCSYLLGRDPGEPEFLEEITVTVARDGVLTVAFRDRSVRTAG